MRRSWSLTFVILLLALCGLHAETPPQPKSPQPLVEEYRLRALEYLKANRPSLNTDQLVFQSIIYTYASPQSRTAPSGTYVESLTVAFCDPSSRTESPRGTGEGKLITTQDIAVTFSNATSEPVKITTSNVSEFAAN